METYPPRKRVRISSSHRPFSAGHLRGYRICDNCGRVEGPTERFGLCGGCKATQYCSSACQRLDWAAHKPICQHTVAVVERSSRFSTQQTTGDAQVVKSLRKFTSFHSILLGWAGFQALQLKKTPNNIIHNALLIVLEYRDHVQAHMRFRLLSSHIVPRTYIRDSLVNDDIQRRQERCKNNDGFGTLIVIIQCGHLSQVMPIEIDSPADISWEVFEEWEAVLSEHICYDRPEFKPPSISSDLVG